MGYEVNTIKGNKEVNHSHPTNRIRSRSGWITSNEEEKKGESHGTYQSLIYHPCI